MKLYREIVEKLLEEVDVDIREAMLKIEGDYKGYELLSDAPNVILAWQELRDRNKE